RSCALFRVATQPTAISTLSLHDALPIFGQFGDRRIGLAAGDGGTAQALDTFEETVTTLLGEDLPHERSEDFHVFAQQRAGRCEVNRKSTRLNSSHVKISYAVFCLKKKIT